MSVDRLNQWDTEEAREALGRCCGSQRWVEGMLAQRPFRAVEDLFDAADRIWDALEPEDWKEAFAHHPKIGDVSALREKFASTADWAEGEQAGARQASEETLSRLTQGNHAYEARFGYIFIVCATGKSAPEMLALLEERLGNDPETELRVAAREQAKITRLRLEKLLS